MNIKEGFETARKHHLAGNFEEAEKIYRKILSIYPSNVGAYYEIGNVLQDKGQFEEAIMCYHKAIELDPNFAGSYNNLGNIFRKKNQIDEAISSFHKAIELAPNFWGAYYNLGDVYQEKGEIDSAIFYYGKALQLNPFHPTTYNNLGNASIDKGQLDEAITYYQKALQLNPNLTGLADNIKQIYKIKAVKKLLQKENPLILEIGSHVGGETKLFLNAFRDIKIFCFEPDPRCIKKFKSNIKDSRCFITEVAVSNTDGTTLLNLSGGCNPSMPEKGEWDFSSSIKKSISNSQAFPWLTFDSSIEVKTIKLDTWVIENKIDYIDFIWSDIQGAERDMIEGAMNALKITKYLYMEYGDIATYPEAMTRDETITLLKQHNFKIVPELSDTNKTGNLLFKKNKL